MDEHNCAGVLTLKTLTMNSMLGWGPFIASFPISLLPLFKKGIKCAKIKKVGNTHPED